MDSKINLNAAPHSDFLRVENGKLFHAGPWDFDLAYNFVCLPTYWIDIERHLPGMYSAGWNAKNPRDFAEWIGADGSPSGGVIEFGRNIRIFFYHLFKHKDLWGLGVALKWHLVFPDSPWKIMWVFYRSFPVW